MTPGDDDGRPRHRTGPNVVQNFATNTWIIPAADILAALNRRADAALRLPPLESGDRDPMTRRSA